MVASRKKLLLTAGVIWCWSETKVVLRTCRYFHYANSPVQHMARHKFCTLTYLPTYLLNYGWYFRRRCNESHQRRYFSVTTANGMWWTSRESRVGSGPEAILKFEGNILEQWSLFHLSRYTWSKRNQSITRKKLSKFAFQNLTCIMTSFITLEIIAYCDVLR